VTCISVINAEPYYFLPEHLLKEPIARTFTGSFNKTTEIQGTIYMHSIVEDGSVIGYRCWQNVTGMGPGPLTLYGTTILANSTYPQAIVGPKGECLSPFNEYVNCDGWKRTQQEIYTNRCSIKRIHTTIEGEMKLVVHVDTQSNLKALLTETIIEGTAFPYDLYLGASVHGLMPKTDCPF
jgi:hypothetical protein